MVRNKLGYLLFLIISGLFAILYNEYFMGVIFLVAVILPLVLLGIAIVSSFKVTVKLDTTTRAAGKEEFLNLTVNLKNTSIFPISRMDMLIQYYNEFSGEIKKENIQITLDQKSSQNVSCQITSKYCGNLIFEIKKIRLYDYFHLCSINKKINQAIKIAVIPEAYEISEDIIAENNKIMVDSDIYSKYKPGDDPSEVFGIREYREGDKQNRIHWKLSYKQEELMIKEFSDPIRESIVILFDIYCGEKGEKRLQYVDGLLDCALSVSCSLLLREHIHKFVWYDQDRLRQFVIRNQTDSFTVMEAFLRMPVSPGDSVIGRHDISRGAENDTHMIYITSVLKEEDLYCWADNYKGAILYLMYVNELDVHPVREEVRSLLKDMRVIFYELDLNNINDAIMAIGFMQGYGRE